MDYFDKFEVEKIPVFVCKSVNDGHYAPKPHIIVVALDSSLNSGFYCRDISCETCPLDGKSIGCTKLLFNILKSRYLSSHPEYFI